jgi:outer membrane protein insertion porin family
MVVKCVSDWNSDKGYSMAFRVSERSGISSKAYFVFYLLIAVIIAQIIRAGSCPAEMENDPAKDIIIGKIKVEIIAPWEKATDRWEKIARNLIYLQEGQPFSDTRFSQTVSALNRSRLFQSIDIPDPDWTAPPITMVFRLQPFARIKNIRISGGFPMLEQEIINVMTIHIGDAYVPEKIEEQSEFIKKLFKTEGYINPKVTLAAERDAEDGHYIVNVRIDKGDFYEITRVRTEGNENYSGKRLLFRLNTWQSSMMMMGAKRFNEESFEEDKKTIRQFYWEKGFCETQVDADVIFDKYRTLARITFNIVEGPNYDLKITGNNAFWTRTLKNDLVIFEEGNLNDFGMRRSIRNIENRYKEAGFLDVRITRDERIYEEKGQPVRSIELVINEGPRYIVENILIQGNENISSDIIKEQMLTAPPGFLYKGQYVPRTLNEDIGAIRSLYRQRGYLSAIIYSNIVTRSDPDDKNMLVDVGLTIREGPQNIISDIKIENLIVFDENQALEILSVQPGSAYQEQKIQEGRIRLAAKISEKGYPHVRVDTENIVSLDGTSSELIFRVNEGPYTEMGKAFFTGNFLTRETTLQRQLQLEESEPFSLSEFFASQRDIRNINALETARFQAVGLEERAERVTLLTEVTEKKPYFFQFATGYDTTRLFYFNTGVGTINLLGRNKELRTFAEWSMIGYKAEIGYMEPNLFNTAIVTDTIVFTEDIEELNKNFGVRSTGASVNFSRPFTPRLSASLNFLYDFRNQYRTDDTPIAPEDENQFRSRAIVVTTPGVIYNSTDSFVRPTQGIHASASVGISHGLDNDLDDFIKYRLNTRYYYTPAERLTLAFLGQIGQIDPYGNQDVIPEDQLFFLGGAMDVRGFSENRLRTDQNRVPVGGRTSIMGSVEARYNVVGNFELAAFYDTGTIRNTLRDEGSDDWRSSAGLGLRYHTPIGPVGLMHGWKLDRKEGESSGAFHFSIGYTF